LQNAKDCRFTADQYTLMGIDVFDAIEKLKSQNRRFDLIYLDPPYTVDSIFHPVMEALADGALLKEGGRVVIRTKKDKEMKDIYGKLVKNREKTWGISTAHFYSLKEED
jgi:16S rRNA G966 N2-methylase RsmD